MIINRWVDIDSNEFKQIENYSVIRRFTIRSVELKAAIPDKNGNLYTDDGKPIHAELGKELVGIRLATKASN